MVDLTATCASCRWAKRALRQVSGCAATCDGKRLLRIRQRWDGVATTPSMRLIDSCFDAGIFRRRSHERVSKRRGKCTVKGYRVRVERISGMKELVENTQMDWSIDSTEPTFNFDADFELLQTLQLDEGYKARVNFCRLGRPPCHNAIHSESECRRDYRTSGAGQLLGGNGDYSKPWSSRPPGLPRVFS